MPPSTFYANHTPPPAQRRRADIDAAVKENFDTFRRDLRGAEGAR